MSITTDAAKRIAAIKNFVMKLVENGTTILKVNNSFTYQLPTHEEYHYANPKQTINKISCRLYENGKLKDGYYIQITVGAISTTQDYLKVICYLYYETSSHSGTSYEIYAKDLYDFIQNGILSYPSTTTNDVTKKDSTITTDTITTTTSSKTPWLIIGGIAIVGAIWYFSRKK